jgi:tetratricopeptide (TPR) repeat protein
MSKKKRRMERSSVPVTPPAFIAGVEEAHALIRHKQWSEAREALEALDQRFPQRPEVLVPLVEVYDQLEDVSARHFACQRLHRVLPDDPDPLLMLAESYLAKIQPVSALHAYQRFLALWPDHAEAGQAREVAAKLEGDVDRILAEMGLSGEDAQQLATLHEEAKGLLESGRLAESRRLEEQILRSRPDFAPALNNISQIQALTEQLDAAIATSRRVLERDPRNVHALANLVRYLSLNGEPEAAWEYAGRLKAIEPPLDRIKQVEALSFLGDDEGVLEAFHATDKETLLGEPLQTALFYHLAAVAAMRLGREGEARRHWQQAVKIAPGLDLVRENLADLRQPPGKRHAPWPFSLPHWIPRELLQELLGYLDPSRLGGSDGAVKRGTGRFLRRHPEIVARIPALLDRGDPGARTFALQIALFIEAPEMLAALREFALSQRGPDEMRTEAAQAAAQAGMFPPGLVRLWLQGEWREIMMLGYELHEEPTREHSPAVETWLAAATLALRARKAVEAEELLRKALAVEPDSPDVLNNFAVARGMQGHVREAEELVRQIHERYPDYVVARVTVARMATRDGDLERAEELLKPLLTQKRFHVEEFGLFCSAHIGLLLAKRDAEAANSWVDMWAMVEPGNPEIAAWRRRLGPVIGLQKWFRRRP